MLFGGRKVIFSIKYPLGEIREMFPTGSYFSSGPWWRRVEKVT